MGYDKRTKIDMGNYAASELEFTAFKWCINNGIYIAPHANTALDWYICVTINDKSSLSPLTYKKIEVWKQIYRFYIYYYNKYNNDLKIDPMLVIPNKKTKLIKQLNNNQLF